MRECHGSLEGPFPFLVRVTNVKVYVHFCPGLNVLWQMSVSVGTFWCVLPLISAVIHDPLLLKPEEQAQLAARAFVHLYFTLLALKCIHDVL